MKPLFYPFIILLNFSEIYNVSADYKKAYQFSNNAIQTVNKKIATSETLLDSLLNEIKNLRAILMRAKAEYGLLNVKTVSGLEKINNDLEKLLNYLKEEKT